MTWLLLPRNEGHPVWTHHCCHHIGDNSGIQVKTPNRSERGSVCGAGRENVFGDGVNDSGDSSIAIRREDSIVHLGGAAIQSESEMIPALLGEFLNGAR